MKIVALPALVIPELHESDLVRNKTWALISIASDKKEWPEVNVPPDDLNFKGLLQLEFGDVDGPSTAAPHFTEAHAREILNFVESKHPYLDLLVIHCQAGVSRSPAVGAAISKIFKGHDGEFFETKYPNMLVYRTILNTHQKRKYPEKALFSG